MISSLLPAFLQNQFYRAMKVLAVLMKPAIVFNTRKPLLKIIK